MPIKVWDDKSLCAAQKWSLIETNWCRGRINERGRAFAVILNTGQGCSLSYTRTAGWSHCSLSSGLQLHTVQCIESCLRWPRDSHPRGVKMRATVHCRGILDSKLRVWADSLIFGLRVLVFQIAKSLTQTAESVWQHTACHIQSLPLMSLLRMDSTSEAHTAQILVLIIFCADECHKSCSGMKDLMLCHSALGSLSCLYTL